MSTIAVYVNHHGLGHSRRTAILLATLVKNNPSHQWIVRTGQAGGKFFQNLGGNVTIAGPSHDVGALEKSALEIDAVGTVAALRAYFQEADTKTSEEVKFLIDNNVSHILCDIPFSMAKAAVSCNVKITGISNFTWDWIYEPLLTGGDIHLFEKVSEHYAAYETLLRLPFSQPTSKTKATTDIPLIAEVSRIDKKSVCQYFAVSDECPAVFISLRGGVSVEILLKAVPQLKEYTVFVTGLAGPYPQSDAIIDVDRQIEFSINDIVKAADVVVSKLGYGTVADCIANRTALVHIPRKGFREDTVLVQAASEIPLVELPIEQFEAGNWLPSIETALAGTFNENPDLRGVEKAVEIISESLSK